jgi:hypothetical protein
VRVDKRMDGLKDRYLSEGYRRWYAYDRMSSQVHDLAVSYWCDVMTTLPHGVLPELTASHGVYTTARIARNVEAGRLLRDTRARVSAPHVYSADGCGGCMRGGHGLDSVSPECLRKGYSPAHMPWRLTRNTMGTVLRVHAVGVGCAVHKAEHAPKIPTVYGSCEKANRSRRHRLNSASAPRA